MVPNLGGASDTYFGKRDEYWEGFVRELNMGNHVKASFSSEFAPRNGYIVRLEVKKIEQDQ